MLFFDSGGWADEFQISRFPLSNTAKDTSCWSKGFHKLGYRCAAGEAGYFHLRKSLSVKKIKATLRNFLANQETLTLFPLCPNAKT